MIKITPLFLCAVLVMPGHSAIAETDASAIENAYWNMIRNQTHVAPFQGYLTRFPDGAHAALARDRIAELTPTRSAPTAAISGIYKAPSGYLFHFETRDDGRVRAEYGDDEGRIDATLDGQVLSGIWVEKGSDKKCRSQRDGSYHWGWLEFTFNEGFDAFTGDWGYCEGEAVARPWTGTKQIDDSAAATASDSACTGGDCGQPADSASAARNGASPVVSDPPAQDSAAGGARDDNSALDLAFWTSISESTNPELFEAYLAQFPNGVFVAIAREKLKQLGPAPVQTPTSTQTATPKPTQAPAPQQAQPQSPQDLYEQADAILSSAMQMDPADWAVAVAPARKLFERAATMNHAPALMSLAYLHEAGLGVPQDFAKAIALYRRAGEAGLMQGFLDAMLLADQVGLHTQIAPTFFAFYKAEPYEGRVSLDRVSNEARISIQRFLAGQGVYGGTLDGKFGNASIAAVDAYLFEAPSMPKNTGTDLASALQTELQRVGCYQLTVDGAWGAGSIAALNNFNHWTGQGLPTSQPTQDALDAVRAHPGPVCGVD